MKPWRAAETSATASGKSTRIASRSWSACSSTEPGRLHLRERRLGQLDRGVERQRRELLALRLLDALGLLLGELAQTPHDLLGVAAEREEASALHAQGYDVRLVERAAVARPRRPPRARPRPSTALRIAERERRRRRRVERPLEPTGRVADLVEPRGRREVRRRAEHVLERRGPRPRPRRSPRAPPRCAARRAGRGARRGRPGTRPPRRPRRARRSRRRRARRGALERPAVRRRARARCGFRRAASNAQT